MNGFLFSESSIWIYGVGFEISGRTSVPERPRSTAQLPPTDPEQVATLVNLTFQHRENGSYFEGMGLETNTFYKFADSFNNFTWIHDEMIKVTFAL